MVQSSQHPFGKRRSINKNPHTFKPQGSTAIGVAGLTILLGLVASEILYSPTGPSLAFIALCSLFATVHYLFFIRSRIVFYDEGVEVFNPLSTHRIDWGSVEEIGAKYSMYIRTPTRTVRVSAAPVSGRLRSRRTGYNDLRGFAERGSTELKGSESPASDSGVAIHIARTRMKSFAESAGISKHTDEVSHNIPAFGMAALAILIALVDLTIG